MLGRLRDQGTMLGIIDDITREASLIRFSRETYRADNNNDPND